MGPGSTVTDRETTTAGCNGVERRYAFYAIHCGIDSVVKDNHLHRLRLYVLVYQSTTITRSAVSFESTAKASVTNVTSTAGPVSTVTDRETTTAGCNGVERRYAFYAMHWECGKIQSFAEALFCMYSCTNPHHDNALCSFV